MRKYLLFIFILLISFLSFNVNAETRFKMTWDYVNVRSGPGTNYSKIGVTDPGAIYDFKETKLYDKTSSCDTGWYHINFNGQDGYICADYGIKYSTTSDASCETSLKESGFPASYVTYLCSLKTIHPNWNFIPDQTGLDFNTAVSKEAVGKKSLIQSNYQGYFSTAADSYDYLTDTFIVKEGSNWYSASSSVVAYYMDPRNFLDESSIFMFEKLSYDSSYQTSDAVSAVLSGRDINEYNSVIIDAAKDYNVNAIYLASRIRQETGGNYTNYSIAGNAATGYDGVYYTAIYNPYNIGANTGAEDGLRWAASYTSYLRPWVSRDIAIKGGAYFISDSYISKGQDTGYYQKFNTSSYSSYSSYSHQYMTNVRAASSEASLSYGGYKEMNLLDATSFTFVIPVYLNMGDSAYSLPNTGNPNNHLKALTVNGTSVTGFSHDKYDYTFYVADGVSSVNINATVINSNAKVSGAGNINLTSNETTQKIVVTAGNGSTQTYTIKLIKSGSATMTASDVMSQVNVTKSDNYLLFGAGYTVESLTSEVKKVYASANVNVNNKTSGSFGTGDTIVISSGGTSLTYNAVVKGDPTGDGNINIQDLLRIQKYILGYTDLSGSYLKACDNNNDGVCNILDLLRTQKHILGFLTI